MGSRYTQKIIINKQGISYGYCMVWPIHNWAFRHFFIFVPHFRSFGCTFFAQKLELEQWITWFYGGNHLEIHHLLGHIFDRDGKFWPKLNRGHYGHYHHLASRHWSFQCGIWLSNSKALSHWPRSRIFAKGVTKTKTSPKKSGSLDLPSGYLSHSHGKIHHFIANGKPSISMGHRKTMAM